MSNPGSPDGVFPVKNSKDSKDGSHLPDPEQAAALSRMCRLVEEHWKHLHKTAGRFCRDRADAEELVHATILHVLERPTSLRHEENPAGWLAIVMARLHFGVIRKPQRRYEHISADDVQIAALEASDPPVSDRELHAAIEQLPRVLRDPLMRFVFDGIPQEQIAAEMKVSHTAIRARIHRARRRLRELLSKGDNKK